MNLRSFMPLSKRVALPLALSFALLSSCSQAADSQKDKAASEPPKDKGAATGDLVPLELKLPPPAFKGTPKDIQLSSYVEPLSDKPRPPMLVPAGLKNIAAGAKITCSDKNATAESLAKITDGDKEASEESIIYLR